MALHFDIAAVRLYDSVGYREAQPDALALRLGGEERIENLRHVLRRDALSIVRHRQHLHAVGGEGRDRNAALALIHGLALGGFRRVQHQVQHHLLDLRWIA